MTNLAAYKTNAKSLIMYSSKHMQYIHDFCGSWVQLEAQRVLNPAPKFIPMAQIAEWCDMAINRGHCWPDARPDVTSCFHDVILCSPDIDQDMTSNEIMDQCIWPLYLDMQCARHARKVHALDYTGWHLYKVRMSHATQAAAWLVYSDTSCNLEDAAMSLGIDHACPLGNYNALDIHDHVHLHALLHALPVQPKILDMHAITSSWTKIHNQVAKCKFIIPGTRA